MFFQLYFYIAEFWEATALLMAQAEKFMPFHYIGAYLERGDWKEI